MNNSISYIKRAIFNEITKHLDKKEISLIIGPRQVGKTVLLGQLQKYLAEEKNSFKRYFFF